MAQLGDQDIKKDFTYSKQKKDLENLSQKTQTLAKDMTYFAELEQKCHDTSGGSQEMPKDEETLSKIS